MSKRLLKLNILSVIILAGIFGGSFGYSRGVEAASLSGRILLQVQAQGQAWYVNPANGRRYFLGRPDDAYQAMRYFGLGVSNNDLNSFSIKAPARLAGRILLKVQDKGQAYYVDPVQLKLYYLGRPTDAFNIMKTRGLGISDRDLSTIPIGYINAAASSPAGSYTSDQTHNFAFKYQNDSYELSQVLSPSLYNAYRNSSKVYTYTTANEPSNLREVFYGLFLKLKSGDNSIDGIIAKLKATAGAKGWSDDQLAEFTVSFIQYIPYDHEKVAADPKVNTDPYFPYETLYLDKGVCSDKTFLGVLLLRKLGYGAAILDFPEINHTALGIACPKEYSLNGSGYCYGETTNYFPLGVIPQTINSGQAQTANEFGNLFDSSKLGRVEIYQKTTGKIYQGMPGLKSKISDLQAAKSDIDARKAEIDSLSADLSSKNNQITALRSQMDTYYNNGQISAYNKLIDTYNAQVNSYNADLKVYQGKISEYNTKINDYNISVKNFYQQ